MNMGTIVNTSMAIFSPHPDGLSMDPPQKRILLPGLPFNAFRHRIRDQQAPVSLSHTQESS